MPGSLRAGLRHQHHRPVGCMVLALRRTDGAGATRLRPHHMCDSRIARAGRDVRGPTARRRWRGIAVSMLLSTQRPSMLLDACVRVKAHRIPPARAWSRMTGGATCSGAARVGATSGQQCSKRAAAATEPPSLLRGPRRRPPVCSAAAAANGLRTARRVHSAVGDAEPRALSSWRCRR